MSLLVFLKILVVSDKFKHNNEGFKYFIVYGNELVHLCIILPLMSGYIKYFENGSKNMSFLIKDDEVWDKSDKIRDVTKSKLPTQRRGDVVTTSLCTSQ